MTPSGTSGSSRWHVHGERSAYDSPWVRVSLVDVEPPGGSRYEHHVVRATAAASGCLVRSGEGPDAGVLLLWRHRFITGRWGWEIPAGRVEPGETPAAAAARETEEETGWRVRDVRPVLTYHPIGGSGDHTFHVTTAVAVGPVAEPDPHEAERVAWFAVAEVAGLVRRGESGEGLTLVALLALLSGLAGPAAGDPGS
ncbi:MAG: NUDIX hydrolase [Kineosporiaceae bacterium]